MLSWLHRGNSCICMPQKWLFASFFLPGNQYCRWFINAFAGNGFIFAGAIGTTFALHAHSPCYPIFTACCNGSNVYKWLFKRWTWRKTGQSVGIISLIRQMCKLRDKRKGSVASELQFWKEQQGTFPFHQWKDFCLSDRTSSLSPPCTCPQVCLRWLGEPLEEI